jgi:hypothetical protein
MPGKDIGIIELFGIRGRTVVPVEFDLIWVIDLPNGKLGPGAMPG